MTRPWRFGAVLALLSAALVPCARAEDGDGGKAGVSVAARPATAMVGEAVTLGGLAPLDGKGEVVLRIQPPAGRPVAELRARPAANGDYSASYTATQTPGAYTVEALSPAGTARGRGSFQVSAADPQALLAQAVAEARAEVARIEQLAAGIAADIDTQVASLPDNPARDELRTRWAELQPTLKVTVRDLGDIDALLAPVRQAVAGEPDLRPALTFAARRLQDWTRSTLAERTRIVQQLAASRRAGVTCESLERVTEGFKLASALTNALGGLADAVKGAAKDFLESQVMRAVHAVAAAQQRMDKASAALDGLAKARQELAANWLGRAADLAAWVGGKAFDRYCERLAGNFEGEMTAEFFSRKTGQSWWSYDISFKGLLDLRYAKGSVAGQAVAVKGEFTGQAVRFTLREDAIRVGFPDVTAGARLFKRALLPKPLVALASGSVPLEDKPIEIDGKAAAVMVQPYGFSVPVEGEIVDGRLTLRMGAASHDYTANARVVYVIVSPLSLVPVATAFELPYKDAGFFFTRVSGGGPVQLAVKKTGSALVVDDTLKQDKGNAVAKGRYRLHLKLCNPAGSC